MGFSLLSEGLTGIIDPNIRGHMISRKKRFEEVSQYKKLETKISD
jgi:hypothetical protein